MAASGPRAVLALVTVAVLAALTLVNSAVAGASSSAPETYDDLVAEYGRMAPTGVHNTGGMRLEFYSAQGTSSTDKDFTVLNKHTELLYGVPAGSAFRGAFYDTKSVGLTQSNGYPTLLDALTRANSRGLGILRVIQDGSQSVEPVPQQIASLLGSSNHRWCGKGGNTACVSTASGAVMHAKLGMFSRTRDSQGTERTYALMASSANHSQASGTNLFNNAVVVYGDQQVYEEVRDNIWGPLWNMTSFADNDFLKPGGTGYAISSNSNVTFYASPESGPDTIAARLAPFLGGPASECKVNVMHRAFTNARSAVADRLIALKNAGCQVRVIVYLSDAAKLGTQVQAALTNAAIPIRSAPIHDKLITISSKTSPTGIVRYFTFTGSQNLTAPGWRTHDEILVKVNSRPIHDAAAAHFDAAWAIGTPVN